LPYVTRLTDVDYDFKWRRRSRHLASLRHLAEGDATSSAAASTVLTDLGYADDALLSDAPAEPSDDWQLRVELPPSWFAQTSDVVNEHPLFQRYLPELRLRSTATIPPVKISTDEDLEPDGYRVIVLEELVEEETVPFRWRLLSIDALDLLPDQIREFATPVDEPSLRPFGGVKVPEARFEEGDLGSMLSVSALEAVTRRLGIAADAPQDKLN
jgi:hypothetical protein